MVKNQLRPSAAWSRANKRTDDATAAGCVLLFNKPYRVLSQFTGKSGKSTLADFIDIPKVYCAGRLDFDSEGLLVLTDDGRLQAAISNPRHRLVKTYWVQVEGIPTEAALDALRCGVDIGGYVTQPAHIAQIDPPESLWPRDPPIRHRLSVPTSWLEIGISEGKNRQVRKMTARVGLPTLRLVRAAIGHWRLDDLLPGQCRWAPVNPAIKV